MQRRGMPFATQLQAFATQLQAFWLALRTVRTADKGGGLPRACMRGHRTRPAVLVQRKRQSGVPSNLLFHDGDEILFHDE